ncbi:MAG: 16S rRNA (cytidine(1402)-2'-O)-methyltransferase [Alphaproteobacteria bacterium]|nr:16S rRNA (cytidine(1402)-2'-O)-methyltransferase [Alphaproteobacteria bacterium]
MARKETSQSIASNSSAREPNGAAQCEQAPIRLLSAGLYPVATPIGNLRDITLRALDVLGTANLIVCEDTRVTRKLLTRYGITTKTISYNDHNAQRVLPGLIRRLNGGDCLALVSDAGTPLISDPGFKLVEAAVSEGIPVYPIPGANAAIAGLVSSGLPTDSFFFAGFLPPKRGARRKRLEELARIPGSLVFYESSGRLPLSLADMLDVLGSRDAVVAREITKLHEEVIRGTLLNLAATYGEAGGPRGEIVVIVGPPGAETMSDETVEQAIRDALTTMSVRDAASEIAQQTGRARREVYGMALAISGADEKN